MDCLDIAFDTFKHTAFRVETLPQYQIYDTAEFVEFEKYISNKPIEGFANQAWINDIQNWVSAGKRILRLRIIPEHISDYFNYEANWCYPKNRIAGEDIKFVTKKNYILLSKKYDVNDDFWVFDNDKVIILKYNEHYEFDKVLEVADSLKDKYLQFFEELEALAVEEWKSQH